MIKHNYDTAQHALWSTYALARRPRRKPQKKSEKRQRTERVTVRLLPAERAALIAAAASAHVSVPEFLRSNALRSFTTHIMEETQ